MPRGVEQQWGLVDDIGAVRSGGDQMAVDLSLVDDVGAGRTPVLRLYTWSGPALSIGRFQPEDDVDGEACSRHGVEVVRRPTGGRALLHGADLTYAVVLPRPAGAAGTVDAVYCLLAQGLIAGLGSLGVTAAVAETEGDAAAACFASMRGSDLRVGGRKLCGSAQVHRGGVVLQHGSILLARTPFDETDLLRYPSDGKRAAARRKLADTTVTLSELGVIAEPHHVAEALINGFKTALNVAFGQGRAPVLPAGLLSTSS